jgi:hypothetical protein
MNNLKVLSILSIDIGIINLGYNYSSVILTDYSEYFKKLSRVLKSTEYYSSNIEKLIINDIKVLKCDRVNITNIKHSKVNRCDCKLHHDFCIPDYLDHFIQENSDLFESADLILIERQPPVGITNVQDLLFSKFRNKVVLMNPVSIHKYFILSMDYSTRKIESEKIAQPFLYNFDNFNNNTRKHDISDSLLMLLYFHKVKSNEYYDSIRESKLIQFEQFRL